MAELEFAKRPGREGAVYGRRKGKRLRARPAGLLASALPALAINLSTGKIDPHVLLDRRTKRLEVEIGFGGGEHLASAAARAPNVDFLGCEPFINGVAKMLARIESLGLANVRLHAGDATDLLEALPERSVDRIHLLFPDPWPKRRQHKRRFVSDHSLALMARVLKHGGELRFATDIDDYAAWTLARTMRCRHFEWRAKRSQDWLAPWPDWPGTRYEAKAVAQGRRAVYLTFIRSASAP